MSGWGCRITQAYRDGLKVNLQIENLLRIISELQGASTLCTCHCDQPRICAKRCPSFSNQSAITGQLVTATAN